MEKYILILLIAFLLFPTLAHAKRLNLEKEYQAVWCEKQGGKTEYVLEDRTRVDCLTSKYAIEFDFADKWAESIGQALYYSLKTGKEPGIVLIMEDFMKDLRYYERLKAVADAYGIDFWVIQPYELMLCQH